MLVVQPFDMTRVCEMQPVMDYEHRACRLHHFEQDQLKRLTKKIPTSEVALVIVLEHAKPGPFARGNSPQLKHLI
jgi:hypothetical protein